MGAFPRIPSRLVINAFTIHLQTVKSSTALISSSLWGRPELCAMHVAPVQPVCHRMQAMLLHDVGG